ncbi:hypothetical protein [Sunxiuqinia indica]|nr:hypothetical protein [Sunxiuqinia indica]
MQTNPQPSVEGANSTLIDRLDVLYEYDRDREAILEENHME